MSDRANPPDDAFARRTASLRRVLAPFALVVGLMLVGLGLWLLATPQSARAVGAFWVLLGVGWLAFAARLRRPPVAAREVANGPATGAWKYWAAQWPSFLRWSLVGGLVGMSLDALLILGLRDTTYLGGGGLAGAAMIKVFTMIAPSVFYPVFPAMELMRSGQGRGDIAQWRAGQRRLLPISASWLSVLLPALAILERLLR